ncbi:FabD/lysophospholipase-like protein [Penicillium herquei]|nr:FabD/lysophospholipase-like protein [Penicillium herquei]
MRMDVQSCKSLFQDLAKKVLAPTRRRKFLRSLLSDGLYDVEVLEEALQDHYGSTRRLFDTPPANLSSNKVAVIASEIQDGAPFIFANYNGSAPHRAEPAYGRLRPDSETEPYVWQVARATSAAPSLFSTVSIPGIGTFQDGGMRRHNNPVNLALSEAKHLWPNSPSPDVVISLGTGSGTKDYPSKSVSNFRNVLVDGWMPRIYRSFSSSFEGSTTWREFLDSVNEKHRDDYFRFDVTVPGGLPRMDNVDCMDRLSKLVRSDPAGVQKHKEAIASLLASSFYFQLDAKPEYYSGFLQCIGSVRCRAPAHYVLNWIHGFDSSRKDFYKDSINLGIHLSSEDICEHCQRYSRRLRFMVRDLKQTIGLSIQFGGRSHSLSALPNSIQWFIEQQGLDGTFGSPAHTQASAETGCPICEVPRSRGQWFGKKRKYVDI